MMPGAAFDHTRRVCAAIYHICLTGMQ